MMTLDDYLDDPDLALTALAQDEVLSQFLSESDYEAVAEDGMMAMRLTLPSIRPVLKRIFGELKTKVGDSWVSLVEWICSESGFDWCKQVARLGENGAAKYLRDKLSSRASRWGAVAISFADPTQTMNILAALGVATGELDALCGCNLKPAAL